MNQKELNKILEDHKKYLNYENGGVRANLSGVNLSGANHNMVILKSISGLNWNIVIKNDVVKVGCQEHKYNEWKSFTSDEIGKMSDDALKFYPLLMEILKYNYKNTKFE